MSLVIYPLFEDEDFRVENSVEARAILDNVEILDELAISLEVTPLLSFDGAHMEVPEGFDGDPSDLELSKDEWTWFESKEGLNTLNALLCEINNGKLEEEIIEDKDEIIEELISLRYVLLKASKEEVRFMLIIA